MRIAQIAPIAERVPPKKYGGTERVIHALTEELVKMGHDVTLFASGDSITSAKLISVYPKSLREAKINDLYGYNVPSMMNMGVAYAMQDQFDVIHDHNPHINLPTANLAKTPVIMTWHGPFSPEIRHYFSVLNQNAHLVSISHSQARQAGGLRFEGNVYNGLSMDHYPFSSTHKNYLLYVGRIDAEKGLHLAIDVAAKLRKKLIVAAKLDDFVPLIKQYYLKEIKPRLAKYKDLVSWIGEVDEVKRNDLMKHALCLLHPVTWPEPFGLTMIEAMACGCPVVALNQGSIPEVVAHGKTGFVVNNLEEMAAAVLKLNSIDRKFCRTYALANFSAKRMAAGYTKVYEKILLRRKQLAKLPSIWPDLETKKIFKNLVFKPFNN